METVSKKLLLCVDSSEITPSKRRHVDGPVFHQVSPRVFRGELVQKKYKWMRSSLLSATAQRLLIDKIKATSYCSTFSEDSANAGMENSKIIFC